MVNKCHFSFPINNNFVKPSMIWILFNISNYNRTWSLLKTFNFWTSLTILLRQKIKALVIMFSCHLLKGLFGWFTITIKVIFNFYVLISLAFKPFIFISSIV